MKNFVQLSKNCQKDDSSLTKYKLFILGDCATQHLATAIRGYAFEEGYSLNIFDADYNQIDAQILDETSELYSFAPNAVLIYMCAEKLYETFCATPLELRSSFADTLCARICGYWDTINARTKTNILHFAFLQNDDRVFGNYAPKTNMSFGFQVQKLNYLLSEGCQSAKNVFLINLNDIQASLGRGVFQDKKMYYVGKLPISTAALPYVSKTVVDTINALGGRFKKCVVLDLDNTLWGGVVGDDGMDGIEIGELGIGHAFTDFQMWLRELKNRGIILAVCSKNNDDTAKEPFIKHPEMVLRLEDISVFVANWEDKASNIFAIQQTLNIGMDSIVFIDDNKFEREAVKSLIPDITVPDMPEDPALYLDYLKSLNLFETVTYSDEDKDRTAQYRAEAGRISLERKFSSYDEYLQGLEMVATAKPFDAFHYPRIAQLTQRSNQFNLRTVRYTEAEIETLAKDNRYITLYFCLRDKFGDHGLISVVILDKPILHAGQPEDTLFISEWLMSCRVLKRGMEEFIVNKIIKTAKSNGFVRVYGEYIKTSKNSMVADIFARMGFEDNGSSHFEAKADSFSNKKTFILEEKEHE